MVETNGSVFETREAYSGAARVSATTMTNIVEATHDLRSRTSVRRAILPGLSEERSNAGSCVVIYLLDLQLANQHVELLREVVVLYTSRQEVNLLWCKGHSNWSFIHDRLINFAPLFISSCLICYA